MGLKNKLWSTILCLVTLVMGGGVVWAASPRTAWLSAVEPIIEKVAELPENQEPTSLSRDCTPTLLPNGSGTIDTCAYKTPIGTMAGTMLLDGPKGSYPYDPFYGGAILPSIPNRPNTIVTATVSNGANIIRLGAYDPALLKYAEYYGGKKVYEYRGQPSTTIKIPGDTSALGFNSADVAYSNNGDWLVGVVKGKGIFRYDLKALQGKLIAWDANAYTYSFGYKNTGNVAISDDGRFVAITFSVPSGSSSRPSLRVYDTQTCRDQYPNFLEPTKHNGCEYKDYWTGEYRTGNTRGIRDVLPTAEYPRRVRFTGIDTLTFDTIYDRTGPSAYKVARYSLRVPTTTSREYVSVLGMGDSYISGEGAAGTYSAGTDTKQNKCHLSWFSYPYRAGAQAFQYGHSVACSGATMFDVSMAAGDPETDPEKKVTREDDYLGQTTNRIKWVKRSSKESIKSSLSPGYAQQVVFAREYKPRTILLSIGGNDVAFAKILTTCVAGDIAGTCYQYYEDRAQLMEQILGQYERLVKTYKSVLAESGGARVYVVGYPQILKEGGACGANVHFNAAEVQFGTRLITYLNSIIKRAAAEAGVYYVDTESALNGYRLCEAPKNNAGVNGLTTGDDKGVKVQAHVGGKTYSKTIGIGNESYHPTALGHKLLAQRVMSSTTNLTAQMPAPKANNKPNLDYTSSLLKDVGHAPEQQRHREAIKWSDGEINVLVKKQAYATNLPNGTLKPGTNTIGTLRSEPTMLFEGAYDEAKAFVFTIPDSIPAGLHTFDIYGVASDGSPVNLREVVYVAEKEDDFDGDGTPNEQEACVLVDSLGIDQDNDGADDACDSELRDISINDSVPELPATSPVSFDPDEDIATPNPQGIVVPYIPPEDNNVNDNDSSQPKDTATLPSGTTSKPMNTNGSTTIQQSLLPYFGYTLTPPGVDVQNSTDTAATAATNVLGKKTAMPEKPNRQTTRESNTITLIALATAAFVTLVILRVFRSRRV